MNKRRCVFCREYFDMAGMIKPNNGWFCSIAHMASHGLIKSRKNKAKADKKAHSKKKRELKDNDKSFQTKKTQEIFNRWVRVRDNSDPCISCLRFHDGQYHAGHYRTVGANPELRFDKRNCHKQCAPCNNHLSGNIVNYRVNLINKISSKSVRELEGPHKPKRYTVANLKTIQKWYKRKTNRLLRELEQ